MLDDLDPIPALLADGPSDDDLAYAVRVAHDVAEPAVPRWRPVTEDDVEWSLRRLEELVRDVASVQRRAADYIARIQAWERERTDHAQRVAQYLRLEVEQWARDRRDLSDGRAKSWKLPSGSVTTSAGRLRTTVHDEAALLAWCRTNLPEAIKTVETVRVSALTDAVREGKLVHTDDHLEGAVSGVIVPGVRMARGATTASVHLSTGRMLEQEL